VTKFLALWESLANPLAGADQRKIATDTLDIFKGLTAIGRKRYVRAFQLSDFSNRAEDDGLANKEQFMISRDLKAMPLVYSPQWNRKNGRPLEDFDRDLSLYVCYGNKTGGGAVLVKGEKTN